MQVVILSGPGWHTDQLSSALTERGHIARVLPYEGLVARLGGPLGLSCAATAILDADAVLARFIPSGSLEQIIYRVDALHWIEEHGVPVVNSPRAIERAVDKFYTDALLQEAGLPVPETVVCEGAEDAMAAIRAMLGRRSLGEGCGDVIIKPVFGSMGHGIVRVSDPDVAFRVLQSLEQVRAVFYVQRAVDSGGRDVRAFVVGGRVLGAIERRAEGGDWRTNVSRGGSARPFDLPPAWEALALGAAAAVGADYAGVDLVPSQDGAVFVLEVNGIPGWQGLQRATGIDVAGAIVEHVLGRVRASRTASTVPLKPDPTEELPA
jgi:RimK family alpha-L-glutamate ligase